MLSFISLDPNTEGAAKDGGNMKNAERTKKGKEEHGRQRMLAWTLTQWGLPGKGNIKNAERILSFLSFAIFSVPICTFTSMPHTSTPNQ